MSLFVCELPLDRRTCRSASSTTAAAAAAASWYVPLKPDSPRLEKRLVPALPLYIFFILTHNIKIVPRAARLTITPKVFFVVVVVIP